MEGYDLKSKLKVIGAKERTIQFFRSLSLYKTFQKRTYYMYKYINDFIINIKRTSKTVDIRKTNLFYVGSSVFAFLNYPFYRIFFEYGVKSLNPKNTNGIFPNFNLIRKDIFRNSFIYTGFTGFYVGFMFSFSSYFFDSYFNPTNGIYWFATNHILSLSIAYPYILNSNYKILKSPKHIRFTRNPFKYMYLLFNRDFYTGYREWFIMNFMIFIPFYNLKAYKYEKLRICKIAAHVHEKGDYMLKGIEKCFYNPKNNLQYGKYFFNFFPFIYNIYLLFYTVVLICFYDYAGKYVNLHRLTDSERYREAIERKYPRKPNEYYLDLWGPFLRKYKYHRKEVKNYYDDEEEGEGEEEEEEEEEEDDE